MRTTLGSQDKLERQVQWDEPTPENTDTSQKQWKPTWHRRMTKVQIGIEEALNKKSRIARQGLCRGDDLKSPAKRQSQSTITGESSEDEIKEIPVVLSKADRLQLQMAFNGFCSPGLQTIDFMDFSKQMQLNPRQDPLLQHIIERMKTILDE